MCVFLGRLGVYSLSPKSGTTNRASKLTATKETNISIYEFCLSYVLQQEYNHFVTNEVDHGVIDSEEV